MADFLAIPRKTWLNYESGVVLTAYAVLQLIVTASVYPLWLPTGQTRTNSPVSPGMPGGDDSRAGCFLTVSNERLVGFARLYVMNYTVPLQCRWTLTKAPDDQDPER
jgi:hypothetical protein